MNGKTQYRDAWAGSKQATPPQVLQATANVVQEMRRGAFELDKLIQELGHSPSFRDFYASVDRLTEISRSISYNAHNLKLLCDLQIPPASLYTDHYLNQFLLMSTLKRTWWVEGPAFCGLAIKPSSRILELGCGTGYYTDIFFSPFAAEIVAIDIDPRAIETARRMHQAKNIRYELMDFRKMLPDGPFDVVIWTPTIFAYTPDEVDALMARLRRILAKNAVLGGATLVEAAEPGEGVLWHDLSSMGARLKKYFANVRVFERTHVTIQPPRHQLYFYASDGPLPFDTEWTHGLRL